MFVIYLLAIGALVAPSLQVSPDEGTPRRAKSSLKNMTIIHKWKNMEYAFDTPEDEQYAIENNLYKKEGFKRPYDIDLYINKRKEVRIFVSTPRVVGNIPYSLAYVSNQTGEYGPKLLPYPNLAAHLERDNPGCDRIVSVFRTFVDDCNHLWAIDSGRDFTLNPPQICPPKILVYDLATTILLLKYVFPDDQYVASSVKNAIIVDIYDLPPKGKCLRGKAYVSDPRGAFLSVYDLELRTSWSISNDLFKYNEAYAATTIAGTTFNFPDGIYTVTPVRETKLIYLHSFTSLSEVAAKISDVNNQSLWINNPSGNQDVFKVIGTRPTQTPTQARDSKGNIYFSRLDTQSIVSWKPRTAYTEANFKELVRNTDLIEFTAGIKIRKNSRNTESLLVLNIPLQKLFTGTASLDDDNFVLMACDIPTLQSGKGRCGGL